MTASRTGLSDWMWAGQPSRRLLVSIVVTLVVLVVPYLAGYPPSAGIIGLFIGWDLGAWYMDKLHVDRRAGRSVVPE